jgi:hypothetical protein
MSCSTSRSNNNKTTIYIGKWEVVKAAAATARQGIDTNS